MLALFRRFLPPYRGPLMVVLVLLFAQTIAQLYLPALNAQIINDGVVTGDVGEIVRLGAIMLVVPVVYVAVAIVGTWFSARTALSVGRDLRSSMFRSVQTFSLGDVDEFGTASPITRNTNAVQQVQQTTLMAFTVMVSAPIMLVRGVFGALRQDAALSGLLLVIISPSVTLPARTAFGRHPPPSTPSSPK